MREFPTVGAGLRRGLDIVHPIAGSAGLETIGPLEFALAEGRARQPGYAGRIAAQT